MHRRALFFSHHFYPAREVGARRMSELARSLRDAGWAVTVIAAEEVEVVPELAKTLNGVNVIRIRPPTKLYRTVAHWRKSRRGGVAPGAVREKPSFSDSGENTEKGETLGARLKRYYHSLEWLMDDQKLWSLFALAKAMTLPKRWDWVISSGPPVSVHVAARIFASVTGTPWLMDLRDPWVGNGHWNRFVQTPLRDWMERFFETSCVRRADRITSTSPGIVEALVRRFPEFAGKMHVVYNGFDGIEGAASQTGSGQLRLLYAGSLYYNRDPFPLIRAVQALLEEPAVDRSRVKFTLVGNCREWNGTDLSATATMLGIDDCVNVLPAVSPMEIKEMINASEILVNFAQGQPVQIPAKLYEHLASGREMLLIAEANSDSAKIVLATGRGRVVEPGDEAELRRVLRDLYTFYVVRSTAFRPHAPSIGEYSREKQNRRFLRLLSTEGVRA